MNVQPLVTILALCHKHESFVIETLESIRVQTYPNIQFIIIENASVDGSLQKIKDWVKVNRVDCELIVNTAILPLCRNLNNALAVTKGKYFYAVSCDDVLSPDKIRTQVDLFEQLPEQVACIYADMAFIDANGLPFKATTVFEERKKTYGFSKLPEGSLRRELSYTTFISAPSVMLRTSALEAVGRYDESLMFEDWPMWITLSRQGFLFYPLEEVVVKYRILDTSMDRTKGVDFYNDLLVLFEKNADYLLVTEQRSKAKWFQYLLLYKKTKGQRAIKRYYKYVKYTSDFNLKHLIRILIPNWLLNGYILVKQKQLLVKQK
jgi:glycosyltransferase involved in cell wall biosynthesis